MDNNLKNCKNHQNYSKIGIKISQQKIFSETLRASNAFYGLAP
jgi:hypothetical protein